MGIRTFNKAQAVGLTCLRCFVMHQNTVLSIVPPDHRHNYGSSQSCPYISLPSLSKLLYIFLPFPHWSCGPVSHGLAPRPLQEPCGCYLDCSPPKKVYPLVRSSPVQSSLLLISAPNITRRSRLCPGSASHRLHAASELLFWAVCAS